MNDFCIFFNTQIEDSGILSRIGNLGLRPVRQLFNGKTIKILPRQIGKECEIEYRGPLKSYPFVARMIETALAITLLVPGLLLASFKGLAYIFSDIRKEHAIVKRYFTPINKEIGSALNPIKSHEQFIQELREIWSDKYYTLPNALIIHGDGNFTIDRDPGFLFSPRKIILDGVNFNCKPLKFRFLIDHDRSDVVDVEKCKKWDNLKIHQVTSIDEALKATAPRRSWFSCERYHQIFSVAKPQTV